MPGAKIMFIVVFVMMLVVSTVQAEGDPARGLELSENCVDCHGDDGKGDEDNPSIAGLDVEKHVKLLKGYMYGVIVDQDDMMVDYVKDLSDQDMEDLAAYYVTLSKE